jgi:hypothetical protein
MKYLITGLPGGVSVPSEHGAELLHAGLAWIKAKQADGTIDSHYSFYGGGGMAIINGDSHEQILEQILSYPLYPFFDWEVSPLIDFESAYQSYANFYQRLSG